ncbi:MULTISPECIES: hypothetical protein [unclassified Sinorhizobium]|uniref:hypothetical protein n=1 Tax=unclassified Sinorhizobium TaxID=2613772 RepID=UPI00352598F6
MSQLSETVAGSLKAIRDINDNIERLRKEAKAARAAAIEPFLESLAATGEVSLIVVYGYTPGFNDGEPCVHSSSWHVNIEGAQDDDLFDLDLDLDLPEEITKGLKPDRSWDSAKSDYVTNVNARAENIALCRKHGHMFLKPSDTIMKAISDVIYDTIEEEKGTNYYVTYTLKDGKFEKSEGYYYCGY